MNELDSFLHEFKAKSEDWFARNTELVRKYYLFFKQFFDRTHLENATWEDIQKLGQHVHAFQSMAIARGNALGKPNHPIEHYRNSFLYLAYGEDDIETRIRNFVENPRYRIKYFGKSVISEIIGNLFADQFVYYNARDQYALRLLNIDPGFKRGDKFVDRYFKFNQAVQEVVEKYRIIVTPQTDLPLNLEVDQFFSFLYENYEDPTKNPYWILPEKFKLLEERFQQRISGFSDFKSPGDQFKNEELDYKRKQLRLFNEEAGLERVKELLQAGDGKTALNEISKRTANLVQYNSWRKSFGDSDETIVPILSAFVEAAEQEYEDAETVAPIFEAIDAQGLKPSWDTLSVVLWLLNPDTFVPIKISYYRQLAEELGNPLPNGRPTPESFDAVLTWLEAFWNALEKYHPEDWVDVQSYLWCVLPEAAWNAAETQEDTDSEDVSLTRQSPDNINYWWLNANPNIWNFSDIPVGQKRVYTALNEKGNKRQVYKYFEEVRPGDIVVGYVTSPVKEIVAICKITRELHEGPEGAAIEFQKIEQLSNPIHFTMLKNNPDFKGGENFLNRQGSLFKLQPAEYEIIRVLIDEANPLSTQKIQSYSKQEALADLFLDEDKFDEILALLKYKKNLILQGPPGVGKSFIAKRLAYTLLECKDDKRVEMIQFHQSYAYEDFIQGYRPNEEGKFQLQNGIFYNFCRRAQQMPDKPFVFIIDEINRGNLSKIFGELMLLIEADKRGREYAVALTYTNDNYPGFYIPENLYLIGMMNTADRSLAMVDYALRRRFNFVDLEPEFESEKFRKYLRDRRMSETLVDKIVRQMTALNQLIDKDENNLGRGYRIGHSFFCPLNGEGPFDETWYRRVIDYEIVPLLNEYWFDQPDKVSQQIEKLLRG